MLNPPITKEFCPNSLNSVSMIASRMKREECWSDGDITNPLNSVWVRSISERSGKGEEGGGGGGGEEEEECEGEGVDGVKEDMES